MKSKKRYVYGVEAYSRSGSPEFIPMFAGFVDGRLFTCRQDAVAIMKIMVDRYGGCTLSWQPRYVLGKYELK